MIRKKFKIINHNSKSKWFFLKQNWLIWKLIDYFKIIVFMNFFFQSFLLNLLLNEKVNCIMYKIWLGTNFWNLKSFLYLTLTTTWSERSDLEWSIDFRHGLFIPITLSAKHSENFTSWILFSLIKVYYSFITILCCSYD